MASAVKGMAVAAYGGSLLAYGVEVAIQALPAGTFPTIPSWGIKSTINAVFSVAYAGLGYYLGVKKHKDMLGTLFFVASAHHVTELVDQIRTGTFPTAFVRPAPFVPAAPSVSYATPNPAQYGSGGAAIF
jgi:hypothetical protein